ncbi:anti-sigma factor domain-containing protein [Parasediminibacterium sp. JCM 36343]|uniref:anti-sigma factor domain-containing protein n=1 Tax=Parasediminibacterium sp. JCM 36343 TaxID=3374279 RepID=UPI00397985F4
MADAQEVAEIEQLRGQHPEIAEAIASFEASLEATAFANAIVPNAATREKLMLALEEEAGDMIRPAANVQEAKIVPLQPIKPAASQPYLFKYAAAAAIILLIVSAGLNVYFYGKYDAANKQVVALLNDKNNLSADNSTMQAKYIDLYSNLQLMSDTNIIKVAMKGVPTKETSLATVFWNNKTKDVYLFANNLPKAPAGKQYQLWALVNGKPIDAGVLSDCNGVCKLKNTQKADIFAITLEKAGGSPSPDLTQLYVLGKVGA